MQSLQSRHGIFMEGVVSVRLWDEPDIGVAIEMAGRAVVGTIACVGLGDGLQQGSMAWNLHQCSARRVW